MLYKAIIQGKLEFGTQKTYDKVLKMYIYRTENYHKNNVLFEPDEIFIESDLMINIPRYVTQVYEKSYRNTSALLEYCAQFAVAGALNSWLTDSGKIMHHSLLEPTSEKVAVQQYLKGKSLIREKGKQEEAISAFDAAIAKYDRHAQAYERRAKVNYIMKKYHDAKRDYSKSISLDDTFPYAYYGKAQVHVMEENYPDAIADFDLALKYSVALQNVYWKSRRLKGYCHIQLEQYEKAVFDLKLFTNRSFAEGHYLNDWKRWSYFYLGQAYLELEKYNEALEAFDKSIEMENGFDKIPEAMKLRCRGIAKQKAGKNGYIADIKKAADLGDKEAKGLLKNIK